MPKQKETSEVTDAEKETDQKQIESADDACRCKEVAKKKPGELIRMMLSDLAFWKKK